jgi:HK97 family phage portal protein
MPFIDKLIPQPQWAKDLQAQVATMQGQTLLTTWVNYNNAVYPDWGIFKELEAYRIYDDVYSIVSTLAQAAALVPLYPAKVTKDDKVKNFDRATGLQRKYWQIKALEDLPENNPIALSIEKPAVGMSRYEFMEAVYTYLFLAGEVFMWPVQVESGPERGRVFFNLLQPDKVTVFISNTYPQYVTHYEYNIAGKILRFEANEVIHIKYFNPLFWSGTGQEWRGLSPLRASAQRLSRLKAGMDVSVAQLNNGGVPGVLTEKANDAGAPARAGQRKDNYYRFFQNTANKGMPYMGSGELAYIEIGAALADLKVEELAMIDFKKLCNSYHVSANLFNNDEGAKYDNMGYAERRLYTDAVLPNVMRVRDAIQDWFNRKGANIRIYEDLTGINALQEDLQKQVAALKDMDWITMNEKREVTNYDTHEDPLMNAIIIPTGKMLLSDLEMTGDLPNPAGDYGQQ